MSESDYVACRPVEVDFDATDAMKRGWRVTGNGIFLLLLIVASCGDVSTYTDEHVEIRLVIEGNVTESTISGDPISGAEVELGSTSLFWFTGASRSYSIETGSLSDGSGHYRLEKQVTYLPGSRCPYWVNARSAGYAEIGEEVYKIRCVPDPQWIDLVLIPAAK